MSKKKQQIVQDVLQRWQETIMRTGRADVEGAKKLLQKVYPDARIAVVDTPAQFYIAQGVIRKRVAKKLAKAELCPNLGIDASFVDDLPLSGGPVEFLSQRAWARRSANTLLDRVWLGQMDELINSKVFSPVAPDAAKRIVHGPAWWLRRDNDAMRQFMRYQVCELQALYDDFLRPLPDSERSQMYHKLSFNQRIVTNACLTLSDAVSDHPEDIVRGDYNFRQHAFDATQAEILCRLTNCKTPAIIAFHEIFHLVPAIMRFRDTFLLLAERPTISVNSDGQLHSTTGAAVSYSDGKKFWYVDGHVLRDQGEKIVMAPETLTGKEIMSIANEEERRVAIDRMGWEKYLVEINAKVVDTRENWVDNTVEVLFKVPKARPKRIGGVATSDFEEDGTALRVMLSCRSTGRRYFLAAPDKTEQAYWKRDKAKNIKNCADVQQWMANGAKTEYLPYAKYAMNVVGAS